ncbi:MAG: SwmB domain-containing protein, partial [Phormidesmis sp.]
STVTPSDIVTTSYTPGTNPIQDAAGNDADAFSSQSVTNSTLEMQAPTLQTAIIDGTTLVLTYDEALDGASDPVTTDFTVNVNGSAVTVDSVDADGTTVTVTLASAVTKSDTVTTSYTPGTNPIQDVAGNDAAAFSGQSVAHDSAIAPQDLVFTFEQYVEFQQRQKGIAPIFDEELYLLANPDVQAAVNQGGISSGLQHYNQFGIAEGRSLLPLDLEIGRLKMSNFFDEIYYLQSNPDVATAVDQGRFANGFEHFLQHGIKEGRNPSKFYDEEQYLILNSDVKAAVDDGLLNSGLTHFVQIGHIENRTPSNLFDAEDYLFNNPDVQAAVEQGGFASAFEHYLEAGASEGRSPGLLFAETDYLTKYPDVAEAVSAGNFNDGFDHFIIHGISENRTPSSQFDNSAYLSANSDVAAAIGNGLSSGFEHYFQHGRFEERPIV